MPRLIVVVVLLVFSVVARTGFSQTNLADSLKHIVSLNRGDSSHIYALAKLAQMHRGIDNQKAAFYSQEILKLPDVNPSQTAKAHITLALLHSDRASFDSASMYFKEAQKIADKYPADKSLWSTLYNGLGLLYKKQGNNAKALEYYVLVDELGEEIGKENVAGNQINIATTYNRMGNRREAIKYLFKAMRIFESLGNAKGMSYSYNNLGVLFKQQGNLRDAEIYLKKSLALKEKEGDLKGIANSCNDLSLLFMERKDFYNAITYVDRTIELSGKLNQQELLATAYLNKGKILRMQGKLDEAAAEFDKAKPLMENLSSHFLLASLQAETGKLFSDKHKNTQAINVLISSIAEAEKSSNVEAQLNAHLFLSQAYTANNQHREALIEFQKYHHLKDSVSSERLNMEYKTLETQYEVEKKNTEIAMLKKDQELQAKTAQRQRAVQTGIGIALLSVIIISALLINRYRVVNRAKRQLEIERVRNTIARDLHDDIGSTMSSINIVSQMALQQTNGGVEGHFRKIADQSSDLMERMSDIVWSINPENDSLPMIAAKMKEFTAEILEPKNVVYSFTGLETLNGEILGVETRKNLFLIFKEAINNAAKYSDASEVRVKLSQTRRTLQLEVSDNGKGFDPDLGRKGNGLRNIDARAKAINALLAIQSQPSKGTSIRLDIPLT